VKQNLVFLLVASAVLSTSACGRQGVEVIGPAASSPTATGGSQPGAAVHVLVSGAISAIDAVARTVLVNGTTVAVPNSTRIDGGREGAVTFMDLKVGWRVTIRASQSGGVTTASELVVEERGAAHVEIEGRVSGLTGRCPSLTLVVGSSSVSTSASTVFEGVSCGQLVNGMSVVVDGDRQQNGSINATRVSGRNIR
jgi:uncharacterized protein DUF5666